MFTDSCYFVAMVWTLPFDLLVWDFLFFVFSWVWLTSLNWSFPFSTFYRDGFVAKYCLNLFCFLSWNDFLSSIMTESFARYSLVSVVSWEFVKHPFRPFCLHWEGTCYFNGSVFMHCRFAFVFFLAAFYYCFFVLFI